MSGNNLLGVPETFLPAEPEVEDALAAASESLGMLKAAVEANPSSSLAWATLADAVFDEARPLESYAYSRVGYHRGLDALRKAGWKGQGPIPWSHETNRGVLRSFFALRRAADAIGEAEEVTRLTALLRDADPTVIETLESAKTTEIPIQHNPNPPTESIFIRGVD